ncbi:MAG TPA: hypothetical protein VET24_13095 [Actinomycetota bacterium]|nr:hypothetical protein [Actinomycetota bacterium]
MDNVSLRLLLFWHRILEVLEDPGGFSTAELLGNAAMAIGALVVIWGMLRLMGVNLLTEIQNAIEKAMR